MSRSYSEEFIEQVRFSNNIIDIISDYTKLDSAGKSYKGLCPFHDEKTPSFNVNPDQQLYYCFGCGVGGDIFNFVMDIEGINFVEAIEFLAERADISLPKEVKNPQMNRKRKERKQLLQIHELAVQFYNYLLVNSDIGKECYQYLSKRGFKRETINKFQLGFAPNRWQGLYKFLRNKGYSDQILAKSGLIVPRKNSKGYYDRFRNRVIFTIFNHRGQAIGFGGRIIKDNDQPKYLNSPDTLLFDKSKNLYGLNWAKKSIQRSDEAVMVEGYTDVITAHQFGIENVVASLGTSLTRQQAKLLKRYAERIYIAYDSDTAGAKATLRGLDVLKNEGLTVKVIKLPKNQDPDDFIKSQGAEGFSKLKEEAVSLIQFKIDSILVDKDFSSVDDKVKSVREIIPILLEINDKIELAEYCKVISSRLNIDIDVFREELNNYRVKNNKQDRKRNYRNNINNDNSDLKEKLDDSKLSGYLNAVNGLLRIIINNPEIINKLKNVLQPKDFVQDKYQELVSLIFDIYKERKELDINQLLSQIEHQEAKNLLLKLSVREDQIFYTDQMISDYIKKIKEYQTVMKKERLDTEIKKAEVEGNFDRLSQLLEEYNDLLGKGVN